jgi:hypothetical protein
LKHVDPLADLHFGQRGPGRSNLPMVWATVLVMGIAVIFEPIPMGLAVFMVNRARPGARRRDDGTRC